MTQFVDELPERMRTGGTKPKYLDVLTEIQANPGKWGVVLTKRTTKNLMSHRQSFRRSHDGGGAYAALDIPNFEFAVRTAPDLTRTLYARYNVDPHA